MGCMIKSNLFKLSIFVLTLSFANLTSSKSTKIVGGQIATLGQFPHQVTILKSGILGKNHQCGGSIISSRYILTAAHCLSGLTANSVFVRAGEVDLGNTEATQEQEVKALRLIPHPDHDNSRFLNDIGLIELSSPLNFTQNIQAIKLPEKNKEVLAGEECVVSGFGSVEEDGAISKILRFVYLPAVSDAECSQAFPNQIDSTMVCAGFAQGGADSCLGDSGSPLSCGDVQDEINGIVSFGFGCARPGYFGVYTQVSYFTEWIEAQIN